MFCIVYEVINVSEARANCIICKIPEQTWLFYVVHSTRVDVFLSLFYAVSGPVSADQFKQTNKIVLNVKKILFPYSKYETCLHFHVKVKGTIGEC